MKGFKFYTEHKSKTSAKHMATDLREFGFRAIVIKRKGEWQVWKGPKRKNKVKVPCTFCDKLYYPNQMQGVGGGCLQCPKCRKQDAINIRGGRK